MRHHHAVAALWRHAGRLLDRALLTTWRAAVEFIDDRGHRDAAQIAFFAALSSIPLALLLIGSFGVVFEPTEIRDRILATVLDNIPLAEDDNRAELERTIADSLASAGRLGVFPILLLIVAASGVMSALRHAINQAWDIESRPPLLRRKALDVALVLGAVVILVLSLSLTATRQAAAVLDDEETGGSIAAALLGAVGDVLPFAFVVIVIVFLYRVLPMERPKVREIWPGALVAAALLAIVKGAMELYFEQLADFGALYGSLGALMALLLFLFAASNVIVFGAEFASEWARLPPDDEVRQTVRSAGGRVLALTHRR